MIFFFGRKIFNLCLEVVFFFPILCEGDMYIVLEKTCSNVMKNKQERQDGLSLKQKLVQWFLSHRAQSSNNSEGVKKKKREIHTLEKMAEIIQMLELSFKPQQTQTESRSVGGKARDRRRSSSERCRCGVFYTAALTAEPLSPSPLEH